MQDISVEEIDQHQVRNEMKATNENFTLQKSFRKHCYYHVYLGETFRSLKLRLNENQSHIKKELGESSIADHVTTTRYKVNFEKSQS